MADWSDFNGVDPQAMQAPAQIAAPAPAQDWSAFNGVDPAPTPAPSPGPQIIAPRPIQPNEPGYSPGAETNLSPADYAAFMAGQQQPAAQAQPQQPAPAPQAPQPPAPGVMGRIDQGVRSVAQGATFGFGDEIAAAGDAVTQPVLGRGSDAQSFAQRYEQNLAAQRAQDAAIPTIIAAPGQIAGAVASPVGRVAGAAVRVATPIVEAIPGANALLHYAGNGVSSARNALAAVPIARSVIPAAAEGAAYGGAQGFGDGQGGLDQRLHSAKVGAETGAVLGPVVRGAANLVGGGYQAVRNTLADLGAGKVGPVLDRAGQPLTAADGAPIAATQPQLNAAAQRIQGKATNLPAAQDAANTASVRLIPDVATPENTNVDTPTLYQQTGDQGLGDLYQGVSQKDNTAFITQKNRQNAAQVDTIEALAPQGAGGQAVNLFRQQMADIDAAHQIPVDAGQSAVNARMRDIGGEGSPSDYGASMQETLDKANKSAKARESMLWSAIDPDGSLTVDTSALTNAAKNILKEHGRYATPLGGDEGRIIGISASAPGQIKFSDLSDLRSQLTDAISQARLAGENQTVHRLSQMLGGVHSAMEGAVSSKAASDAAAVQAGTLTPEQTMMAQLDAAVESWKSDANQSQSPATHSGSNSSGTESTPRAMAQMPSGRGNANAQVGRPGSSQRNQGLAAPSANAIAPGGFHPFGAPQGIDLPAIPAPVPKPLQPATFNDEAASRYAAARQATAERHTTYTNAPGVGQIIAPGRWSGEFKLPTSDVPKQIWGVGNAQPERIDVFLKAGGNPADLAGIAAADLRRFAAPDGVLSSGKYAEWEAKNQQRIAHLPPELQARFKSLADAQSALDDAASQQKAARDTYQESAAGQLTGDADPVKKVGSMLSGNRSQAQMRELAIAAAASRDPEAARAGLQRLAVDHILSTMKGDAQAGDTGTKLLHAAQIQKFIRQKAPALNEVMTPQQMAIWNELYDSLGRRRLSESGAKLSGGSDTVQKAAAANRASAGATIIQQVKQHGLETLLGTGTGAAVGSLFGPIGAVAGGSIGTLAARVTSGLRAANIAKVDDLVREAILNPGLGRVLLTHVTPQNEQNVMKAFAAQLGRIAATRGGHVAATGVDYQAHKNALTQ